MTKKLKMVEGEILSQMEIQGGIMITIIRTPKNGRWLEAGRFNCIDDNYEVMRKQKITKWRKGDSR